MVNNVRERRRLKRTDATATIGRARQNIDSLNREQIRTIILTRLDNLRLELKDLDVAIFDKLVAENVTEEISNAEYDNCVHYEENIISTIMLLKDKLEVRDEEARGHGEGARVDPASDRQRAVVNKISMPQLPLPKYSHGEGEDLTRFLSEFEQVIDKYHLSEFEKYIYLKNQVANEPATLLESLDSADRSYTSAKTLLQDAFASEVVRKFNAIKDLSKLKFEVGDDPYRYISTMRQITQTFDSLNIGVNDVMRYFIWNGFNDLMKSQLIAITNNNRPTLNEIHRNIFDATERYLGVLKNTSSSSTYKTKFNHKSIPNVKVETSANAVAINDSHKLRKPKSKYCSLCSTKEDSCSDHSTFECPVYTTVAAKIDRLKELGGCFKCGNTNHYASKCRFRFDQKCRNCSKFHFHYLCPGVKVKRETRETSLQAETVFVGNTGIERYGEDSVIPSFSVTVNGIKLRAMRDSGCQPNFITYEAAKKLQLKPIDKNYPVKINGFNAADRVKTDIVKVKLVENHPPIIAICVKNNKVKRISLPGLSKVVDSFTQKGYHLADDFLMDGSDQIGNFDIILGSNDAQLVCQTEKTFGKPPYSMYADTHLGVLLYGSVERLLRNIDALPLKKTKQFKKGVKQKEKIKSFDEIFAFHVTVDSCNLIDNVSLDEAADDIAKQVPNMIYDSNDYPDNNVENDRLNDFVMKTITRESDGRLIAPLLWNEKVYHNLGTNFELAKAVLHSNLKRLKSNPTKLELYEAAIADHVDAGILEEINDITE